MTADAVLDALRVNIAVLDRKGVITKVNESWRRFAGANGASDDRSYVGMNYLAVCERALAHGVDPTLEQTMDALRSILAGDREEFSIEYPCHSPSEQRWFMLSATRLFSGSGAVIAHENITARRLVEQSLRETEHTLRSVLEALPVGVWVMDRTGRIVNGNPAAQQIWGGARLVMPDQFGEYRGWWLATGAPIAATDWAATRAIRNGETSIGEEIEIASFDGTRKIILNSAVPLFDDEKNITGAIIVNQDISERKRDEAELRRASEEVAAASRELAEALERERSLARIDGLTRALNRRYFFELAAREISVARRYGQPLSLMLFDIDHFKQINDTLGHQIGDEVLKRIANCARQYLRESDIFARYGGDEFVVLLPQTAAAEVTAVAERLRGAVAGQSEIRAERVVPLSISIGIAELRPFDDDLDSLVNRADRALYEAKNAGRNQSVLFSSDAPTPPVRA